jgi:hypothetical protein
MIIQAPGLVLGVGRISRQLKAVGLLARLNAVRDTT